MATRDQLRELADLRLTEARALFAAGLFDGCVYLCGYVIEVALKARICTLLGIAEYPEDRGEGGRPFRTHNFDFLKLLAGLQNEITAANGPLFQSWSLATEWKPELRYLPAGSMNRSKAEAVLEAVSGRDGVLTWLRSRWQRRLGAS